MHWTFCSQHKPFPRRFLALSFLNPHRNPPSYILVLCFKTLIAPHIPIEISLVFLFFLNQFFFGFGIIEHFN